MFGRRRGGIGTLGVPEARIEVTGDPGIDAAAERAAAIDLAAPHLAPFLADPKPTVVAGSTWPSDDEALIPALTALRTMVPELRVLLAPHEPTGDGVGSLIGAFIERGWHPSTLAHIEEDGVVGDVNAVVIERVGVLAQLYAVGDVAYVGGGFHDAGLHSVLEPAAVGVPVLFGPRHRNSRAAEALVEEGGAVVVHDADTAANVLVHWFSEPATRKYAGGQALGYITSHRGAADRTARALEALMTRTRTP
jgi:3-deoxy-D-manno-octulosonic-acid transferase